MDYSKLSNEDLVKYCLENIREAWDEYFRRFNRLIYSGIKRTLSANGHERLIYDQDVLGNIHAKIVIKHISKDILRQCENPAQVGSWLWQVVIRSTYDWLRVRHYRVNLPQIIEEDLMSYLDDSLGGNDESSIGNTIRDYSIDFDAMRENKDKEKELEKVLASIRDIDSEKTFWALRLSYLAHDPLSAEEIVKLSVFNQMPVEEVRNRLVAIMERLETKIDKKIKANAHAVVLYYQTLRLESRLKVLGGKDKELEEDIKHVAQKRQKCLHEGRMFCQPSQEEIASLIGLPSEKETQITNILKRVRESLKRTIARWQEP